MALEEALGNILKELQQIKDLLKEKYEKVEKVGNEIHTGKFLTVKQFCKKNPWPSEHALRSIIFNAKTLKASGCFTRMGRRVLIHEEEFWKWTESSPKATLEIKKFTSN